MTTEILKNGHASGENLEKVHFAAGLPRKEWLRPDEVAQAIGFSASFVFKLLDAGALHGHRHNAASGAKARWRIHRDSVVLYLARTADYQAGDFLDCLTGLFRGRSGEELELIIERAREVKAAKES